MTNNKLRNALIALYVLVVLGFSATVKASEISIFPIGQNQIKLNTYTGEVVATLEGKTYLVVSEEVYYELQTVEGDLSAFNGEVVTVTAVETKYKAGPVFKPMVSDPLSDAPAKKIVPVLIVFGISELTE